MNTNEGDTYLMFSQTDWLGGAEPPEQKPAQRVVARQPNKLTPRQIVDNLGLKKGDAVTMPDGTDRTISRITTNGEVHVRGIRGKINVHALARN